MEHTTNNTKNAVRPHEAPDVALQREAEAAQGVTFAALNGLLTGDPSLVRIKGGTGLIIHGGN